MLETLPALNFGPTFRRWIRTFYQNITHSVTNIRDFRQALLTYIEVRLDSAESSVSPHVFIICVETLAIFRA